MRHKVQHLILHKVSSIYLVPPCELNKKPNPDYDDYVFAPHIPLHDTTNNL